MTRLAHRPEDRARGGACAIVVRWRIGLGPGLDQSTLDVALARSREGWALDGALVERTTARERVVQRVRAAPAAVRTVFDSANALVHVDAIDERGAALLALTLREAGGGAHVEYARTSLLARLGVRGGRHEPVDARIEGALFDDRDDGAYAPK